MGDIVKYNVTIDACVYNDEHTTIHDNLPDALHFVANAFAEMMSNDIRDLYHNGNDIIIDYGLTSQSHYNYDDHVGRVEFMFRDDQNEQKRRFAIINMMGE
jgi:hypothetical protein